MATQQTETTTTIEKRLARSAARQCASEAYRVASGEAMPSGPLEGDYECLVDALGVEDEDAIDRVVLGIFESEYEGAIESIIRGVELRRVRRSHVESVEPSDCEEGPAVDVEIDGEISLGLTLVPSTGQVVRLFRGSIEYGTQWTTTEAGPEYWCSDPDRLPTTEDALDALLAMAYRAAEEAYPCPERGTSREEWDRAIDEAGGAS